MPSINVDGPSLDIEKKRELVKGLTEVAEKVYGIKHILVLIRENKPENVAVNGELISDMKAKEQNE